MSVEYTPVNPLTTPVGDGRYLKLDASNDPMQGDLDFNAHNILRLGTLSGGALVADTLRLQSHSVPMIDPDVDGKIILENFMTFNGITDFTTTTDANFQLISWSPTVDCSGQSLIIPQGFWWASTFNFNTAQAFGGSAVFQDSSAWIETAAIIGSHSSFSLQSFLAASRYTVGHAGAGKPPNRLDGFSAEPSIDAGIGTLTIARMTGFTTYRPFVLRTFLGIEALRNGAICTELVHFEANSGNANCLVLHGGSSIVTEIGFDCKNLSQGTSAITLRSDYIGAPMVHAGNITIPTDVRGLLLGAGTAGVLDASLLYNGTALYLDSSLVNPSDFLIDCGTQKTLELVEPVFDDLRVPLTAGRIGITNPPTFAQYKDNGAGSVGVSAYTFSDQAVAGNEEELFFAVQFPHSYKQGTDIIAHIHWTPAVTGGLNEFVKWGLEYTWQNINGTFGNTTIITSDASSGATATTSGDTTLTADKHYKTNIETISGTGKTISSMLVCRVFRNSSHADDDLPQDAFAFEFDFHYLNNTMGSRQEDDVK